MVAVKVQRPDMLQSVLLDIYIIRRLAQVVEKIKGVITSQRPYDVALVDTFATASLQELDYQQEASNQVSLYATLIYTISFMLNFSGEFSQRPDVPVERQSLRAQGVQGNEESLGDRVDSRKEAGGQRGGSHTTPHPSRR